MIYDLLLKNVILFWDVSIVTLRITYGISPSPSSSLRSRE